MTISKSLNFVIKNILATSFFAFLPSLAVSEPADKSGAANEEPSGNSCSMSFLVPTKPKNAKELSQIPNGRNRGEIDTFSFDSPAEAKNYVVTSQEMESLLKRLNRSLSANLGIPSLFSIGLFHEASESFSGTLADRSLYISQIHLDLSDRLECGARIVLGSLYPWYSSDSKKNSPFIDGIKSLGEKTSDLDAWSIQMDKLTRVLQEVMNPHFDEKSLVGEVLVISVLDAAQKLFLERIRLSGTVDGLGANLDFAQHLPDDSKKMLIKVLNRILRLINAPDELSVIEGFPHNQPFIPIAIIQKTIAVLGTINLAFPNVNFEDTYWNSAENATIRWSLKLWQWGFNEPTDQEIEGEADRFLKSFDLIAPAARAALSEIAGFDQMTFSILSHFSKLSYEKRTKLRGIFTRYSGLLVAQQLNWLLLLVDADSLSDDVRFSFYLKEKNREINPENFFRLQEELAKIPEHYHESFQRGRFFEIVEDHTRGFTPEIVSIFETLSDADKSLAFEIIEADLNDRRKLRSMQETRVSAMVDLISKSGRHFKPNRALLEFATYHYFAKSKWLFTQFQTYATEEEWDEFVARSLTQSDKINLFAKFISKDVAKVAKDETRKIMLERSVQVLTLYLANIYNLFPTTGIFSLQDQNFLITLSMEDGKTSVLWQNLLESFDQQTEVNSAIVVLLACPQVPKTKKIKSFVEILKSGNDPIAKMIIDHLLDDGGETTKIGLTQTQLTESKRLSSEPKPFQSLRLILEAFELKRAGIDSVIHFSGHQYLSQHPLPIDLLEKFSLCLEYAIHQWVTLPNSAYFLGQFSALLKRQDIDVSRRVRIYRVLVKLAFSAQNAINSNQIRDIAQFVSLDLAAMVRKGGAKETIHQVGEVALQLVNSLENPQISELSDRDLGDLLHAITSYISNRNRMQSSIVVQVAKLWSVKNQLDQRVLESLEYWYLGFVEGVLPTGSEIGDVVWRNFGDKRKSEAKRIFAPLKRVHDLLKSEKTDVLTKRFLLQLLVDRVDFPVETLEKWIDLNAHAIGLQDARFALDKLNQRKKQLTFNGVINKTATLRLYEDLRSIDTNAITEDSLLLLLGTELKKYEILLERSYEDLEPTEQAELSELKNREMERISTLWYFADALKRDKLVVDVTNRDDDGFSFDFVEIGFDAGDLSPRFTNVELKSRPAMSREGVRYVNLTPFERNALTKAFESGENYRLVIVHFDGGFDRIDSLEYENPKPIFKRFVGGEPWSQHEFHPAIDLAKSLRSE